METMKLGSYNNVFGKFDAECKQAIIEMLSTISRRENEKISVYSDDLFEKSMWIVHNDGLLWQIVQNHDLVTDEINYHVMFVEGVMVNPHEYVEVNEKCEMSLCVVEVDEDVNVEGTIEVDDNDSFGEAD
jgi:hypothetical protein